MKMNGTDVYKRQSGYFRIFVYLYRQLVREQGYEGVESINGYHPKNICRDHWEH